MVSSPEPFSYWLILNRDTPRGAPGVSAKTEDLGDMLEVGRLNLLQLTFPWLLGQV
jgi:hypothetical protein